jgi:hypothetical protein
MGYLGLDQDCSGCAVRAKNRKLGWGTFGALLFCSFGLNAQLVPLAAPRSRQFDQSAALRVTDRGFSPRSIALKEGTTALLFLNRTSRTGSFTVQITEDGTAAASLTSKQSEDRRQIAVYFTSQPGNYVISTVERPDWKCILNIEPK